ncbi:MAG: M48 family metallopeptidase [Methyloligellaceae bacterium]
MNAPLIIKRNPRARRLTLRISHRDRHAVMTVPMDCGAEEAAAFLNRNLNWLRQRLEALPAPVPFHNGAIIPLRGKMHLIEFVGPERRRGVVSVQRPRVPAKKNYRRQAVKTSLPLLKVVGVENHAPRRLGDWLREQARKDLDERVSLHADNLGLSPKKLAIRDQASRWGSCSSNGVLSFSWRLILAPRFVLDYVAAHEVAHLKEMNHGDEFWSLVRQTYPRLKTAQTWLASHGIDLHRYGG